MLDSLVVIGLATFSLGTIQEADGVQEHSFMLHNKGHADVTMHQGYTSCGCTTIDFERNRTLHEGDTAVVTLRFNPRGKGGEFKETGTIAYSLLSDSASNEKRMRVNMSLVGTCVTSEETLMKQFPIRVSDNLRLSANHFDLGVMHIGEVKERNVVILHRDEDNRQECLTVTFAPGKEHKKGVQHITRQLITRSEGKEVKIVISLDVLIR